VTFEREPAEHWRVAGAKRKAGGYHHGRLREALIAAGRKLLEQHGLKGFTLRECARRAKVSHAAPAHHFRSVKDLLAEIAADGFDELTAAMEDAAARQNDAGKRLAAIGRAYVDFALANEATFQLMFTREARSEDNERLGLSAKESYMRLLGAIAGATPRSTAAARQTMADLAWASVHGFAMLALGQQLRRGELTLPQRLDLLLDALVAAIAGAR
jgi:AcrR family transcriptional regulator